MTDTTCKRRPNSTWTKCRCETCMIDRYRKEKMSRRPGGYPRVPWQAAWSKLVGLVDEGWTATALADAYELPLHVFTHAIARHKAGGVRQLGPIASARLVAPPRRRPTRGFIPVLGTTRRLQALAVHGWTNAEICSRADVNQSVVSDAQAARRPLIAAAAAARIADVYAELSGTAGPSKMAHDRAAGRGWMPPEAWDQDTIDDSTSKPYCARWDVAEAARLRGEGWSYGELSRLYGVAAKTVRDRIAAATGQKEDAA